MQPDQSPAMPPNPNVAPTGEQSAPNPSEQGMPQPELSPQVGQGAPTGQVPPLAMPQIPNVPAQQLPADQAAPTVPAGANPGNAADVDLIEKEWVDQANKIVKETQNDPYLEEEAVEALQVDYLKKRYNHDVSKPDGQNTP